MFFFIWLCVSKEFFIPPECLCAHMCVQPGPTPCNLMNCSPPGSSAHEISQARILEWVAISFSRGSSWKRDQTHVSCIGRQILYHWTTWEVPYYFTLGGRRGKRGSTTLILGVQWKIYIQKISQPNWGYCFSRFTMKKLNVLQGRNY